MMNSATNQYEIIKKIGEGGMGTVYLANDSMLSRKVAIKQLNRKSSDSPADIDQRFQQEALALAQLNHPNITHLYAFIPKEDSYWMVMEYVEGETLEDWMEKHQQTDTALTINIALQVLEGLSHAHKKGIIHRDIKPANIMINADGEVKIMDFGIARMQHSQRMTQHGTSVGTLEYMAPEQIQGNEGDARTDIYATASIMYEMLSGRPPFKNVNDYELMRMKLDKKPAPLSKYNSQVPATLQKIIFKSLSRNPEERFQSATACRQALKSEINTPILKKNELNSVLKTITSLPGAAFGSDVVSLDTIRKRAGNISGSMAVFFKEKRNRPYVLLLLSALVSAIIFFWALSSPDAGSQTGKGSAVVADSSFQASNPLVADSISTTSGNNFDESPSEMYERISGGKVKEEDKPAAGEKQPVQKKTKAEPAKDPVTAKPVTSNPEPKEVNEKEATPEPVKPKPAARDTRPVDVPAGRVVRVKLMQRVSSEEQEKDGDLIRLITDEEVRADGKVIIKQGAEAIGKIVDVIPAGNRHRKALIGIVILKVEAIDGQMLRVSSERYRSFAINENDPVYYEPGQKFTIKLGRGRVK